MAGDETGEAGSGEVTEETLREALMGRDRFILLFAFLLVDYFVLMLTNSTRWGGLVRILPVAVTVLFALHTAGARQSMLRLTQLAVALSVVVGIVQAATGNPHVGSATFLLVAFVLAISPLSIMRRIFRHQQVDVETLFAAVDVYIIIGLVFSMVFIGMAHIMDKPFLAQPPLGHPHQSSDYVYLSFVTLTTVGFGDLTPHTDAARSVVVLEALLGQIFLVTLVARLVSMYNTEGPTRRRIVLRRPPRGRGPTAADGPDGDPEEPEGDPGPAPA